MIVKNLDNTHLAQIVALHEEAFKGFFLSELGTSFLKQYYKAVVKNINALNLGVFDEKNQLIGFAVTAKKSLGFNKTIIKENFFNFFTEGLKIIFSRPKAIYRIIKNLDKKSKDVKNDSGEYCELLSIATHPKKQGLGIGKLLLSETEKQLKAEGFTLLALTTDFFNNDPVVRFYEKSGYTIYYDFKTYPNRKMYKLIKNI